MDVLYLKIIDVNNNPPLPTIRVRQIKTPIQLPERVHNILPMYFNHS